MEPLGPPIFSDVEALRRKYGLTYQPSWLNWFSQYCVFQGRDVLEVGGSLPEPLCLGELGANSWTAVEYTPYYHELGERRLTLEAGRGGYQVLNAKVEELPDDLAGRFDLVVSLSAFEHIGNFPAGLERMYRALRPGGLLLSGFGPVWSGPHGHHLPAVVDADGQALEAKVAQWDHLTHGPSQMYAKALTFTADRDAAATLVYFMYHSPHINRLYSDDYFAYVACSRFEAPILTRHGAVDAAPATLARLRALHPGYDEFRSDGVVMILRKPG